MFQKTDEKDKNFIKRKFAEYYRQYEDVFIPSSLEKREFGFIGFNERTMIRHKGFTSPEEFKSFIRSLIPCHAYYSATYYEKPQEPMNKKGWLGSDLVFDIDSDHIETPCKNKHQYWICEKCQNTIFSLEKCPTCGSDKIKKEQWLCETCLEAAKSETIKLLDFLITDFGFQQKETATCFSGNRGYHVHIEQEKIKSLDQKARKEIVDYVLGTGLKLEYHGLAKLGRSSERKMIGLNLSDHAWRGRITKGIYDFLISTTSNQLEKHKELDLFIAKKIAVNKDMLLELLSKKGQGRYIKGVGPKTWEKLVKYGIKKQGSKIDTVVTTDIHRLIRIPESLHGKTGLRAVRIPINYLEKFDPLKEAIAFPRGQLEVYINKAHKFRLGNETFGPYKRERVKLSVAAGIYLICKKAAKLIRMT